ncbi:unnamed protein product [Cuscuta epithymum]|uniref:Uncharacterized protein n=1 Tax=Cuscuta epithymum TaxID=186058 RepID=A0AAV0D2I0_9ASTE|nr:unnamed protein product [Cuscuta epithymum]
MAGGEVFRRPVNQNQHGKEFPAQNPKQKKKIQSWHRTLSPARQRKQSKNYQISMQVQLLTAQNTAKDPHPRYPKSRAAQIPTIQPNNPYAPSQWTRVSPRSRVRPISSSPAYHPVQRRTVEAAIPPKFKMLQYPMQTDGVQSACRPVSSPLSFSGKLRSGYPCSYPTSTLPPAPIIPSDVTVLHPRSKPSVSSPLSNT